jgi:hypothetical protein
MTSITLFEVSPMGRRNALEANRKSESVSIKPFIWGTPEQACPPNYLPISFGYLPISLGLFYQIYGRRTIGAK